MAHTYTVETTESTPPDKELEGKYKKIVHAWKEDREEWFTVADLERQVADCDNQIKNATDRKAEIEAKIVEANKILAE